MKLGVGVGLASDGGKLSIGVSALPLPLSSIADLRTLKLGVGVGLASIGVSALPLPLSSIAVVK